MPSGSWHANVLSRREKAVFFEGEDIEVSRIPCFLNGV
jgi:hypothetical protein